MKKTILAIAIIITISSTQASAETILSCGSYEKSSCIYYAGQIYSTAGNIITVEIVGDDLVIKAHGVPRKSFILIEGGKIICFSVIYITKKQKGYPGEWYMEAVSPK